MTGDEEEGGDVESSSPDGYCSLSERIVTPDSARECVSSSDAIMGLREEDVGGAGLLNAGAGIVCWR